MRIDLVGTTADFRCSRPRLPLLINQLLRQNRRTRGRIGEEGLKPQFQEKKPRGKKMPVHIARGNATRARVRSRIEHVFAAQKCRLGLLVRTVGIVRARVKIVLANLAYNLTRLPGSIGKRCRRDAQIYSGQPPTGIPSWRHSAVRGGIFRTNGPLNPR